MTTPTRIYFGVQTDEQVRAVIEGKPLPPPQPVPPPRKAAGAAKAASRSRRSIGRPRP